MNRFKCEFTWLKAKDYEVYETNEQDSVVEEQVSVVTDTYKRLETALRKNGENRTFFVAPAPDNEGFERLTMNDLRNADPGPHIELLKLNPDDPLQCLEFIQKWGPLGQAFEFNQLLRAKAEGSQGIDQDYSDQPLDSLRVITNLTEDLQTVGKPNPDDPVKSGAEYFRDSLLTDPSNHEAPYSWTVPKSHYDVRDFPAWDSFGEFIGSVKEDVQEHANFSRAALSFMSPALNTFVEPIEIDSVTEDSSDENLTPKQLRLLAYRMDDKEPQESFDIKLPTSVKWPLREDNEDWSLDYSFRPRSLLEACGILLIEDKVSFCLKCHKPVKEGRKYCPNENNTPGKTKKASQCKKNLNANKGRQRDRLKEFIEDKSPELLEPDQWPRKPSGKIYHPAELLPDTPIKSREVPPRVIREKELSVAKDWIKDEEQDSSKNASKVGTLKSLVLMTDPEDLTESTT